MKIIVASQEDPVARAVAELLGPGEATEWHVGDARLRDLGEGRFLLRRPGLHVHDEALGRELPAAVSVQVEALLFPSVHRANTNRPALTVHPLGNLSRDAEVGGRPQELNPVPARLMTETFLRWYEVGRAEGIETTFEATHHGPLLPLPSFFVEIGSTPSEWGRPELLRGLTEVLRTVEVERTVRDTVVLGIGGGHYMPRFRDMVRRRQVSVGHLVPSHHATALTEELEEQLVARTAHVEGILLAKEDPALVLPRLRSLLPTKLEKDLPSRA